MSPQGHESTRWWVWFIADAVVVVAFIIGFYFREWRLEKIKLKHKEDTGFMKGKGW